MSYEITMPSLGADMSEAKLLHWRVQKGDTVKKGQIIADIETQKAAIEMESFREGVIMALHAQPNDVIPVGGLMATLNESSASSIPVKVSPAARHLATLKGIDLTLLKGTGPEGVIELADVEAALGLAMAIPPSTLALEATKATPPAPVNSTSLINVRAAIAKAMTRSKKEIPHYYLKETASVDPLLSSLDKLNGELDPSEKILLPALLSKIIVDTLKEFPDLNAYYENDKIIRQREINLGVVISLKQSGVIVPALLNTENKNLREFNRALLDLIARARNGKLKNRELTEGTFTISNLGDLGSEEVFGIIFPPQVALLGIGRLQKKPAVINNEVTIAQQITLTLSGDHRATDGIMGSRFLNALRRKLEKEVDDGEGSN